MVTLYLFAGTEQGGGGRRSAVIMENEGSECGLTAGMAGGCYGEGEAQHMLPLQRTLPATTTGSVGEGGGSLHRAGGAGASPCSKHDTEHRVGEPVPMPDPRSSLKAEAGAHTFLFALCPSLSGSSHPPAFPPSSWAGTDG
ncbi:uncharacterized protein LOC126986454 isoform X2 [Eriocheir sinensis]|uniref:uncharacterized protein LOC126986454 isoform X2 n=1 Tax=Eriocheir sinensis TaxID=95602 RepID=UPI0021C838A3|nr:uncharacterized protein LOC126986454 isoform X2 [Eriocheir sinensis]